MNALLRRLSVRSSAKFGLASVAMLCCAVFAMPNTALAAGSFSWNASIKYGITSRSWSQNAGTVTIRHYSACLSGVSAARYSINVYRDALFDTSYGTKWFSCGNSYTTSWTGTAAGTYRFSLQQDYDGKTHTFSGTVNYP